MTGCVETPIPLRVAVLEMPDVESVSVNVAIRIPSCVGVNKTERVQLCELLRALLHPLVTAKSPAAVPVIPAFVSSNGTLPLFTTASEAVGELTPSDSVTAG